MSSAFRFIPLLQALIFASPIAVSPAVRADELPAAADTAHFSQKVLPILKEKCFACHGNDPAKLKGGLDLRTRDAMLKGGESSAPALVPRDPGRSRLYLAITRSNPDLVMPPKDNDKLSPEQVESMRQWIAAGAPWAEHKLDAPAAGIPLRTSGGLSDDWNTRTYRSEDLWAYRPVRNPPVPTDVIDPTRVRNAIDAFIQHQLRQRNISTLAPAADRRTLIRRATFDLHGLPPAPQDVSAFEDDASPDACESLIDRLLQSPRYGEQFARHWLDVVRYADTSGFSNDYERPNAWRYRDYVVRSFNADKPCDRFILEQLAGDELDPANPEMHIATGYLRMGPWEHTGMTVAAVTRQQWLDDTTHNVGAALLAQPMRCAACHDHKFDPIPTRDYYRLQAVFATTHFAERSVPFLPSENVRASSDKQAIERELRQTRNVLASLRQKNQQAVAAAISDKGVPRFEDLPREGRANKAEFGLTHHELSIRKIMQKRADYFERALRRFEPEAFSVYAGTANNYTSNRAINPLPAFNATPSIPVVTILLGGSLESAGDPVTPGVLSAIAHQSDVPTSATGRRLALARWIASRDNPLTARVIVNRVWQAHFGTGLVSTPNNFGKMGAKPTHPDLLDYLANWFIDNGWSLKKLHRLILTSDTYRLAGAHSELEKLRQLDAGNQLLAYFPPRRLAAEEIRDAMLAVSGELNLESTGPGVFPEINWEVAFQPRHIMGSVAPAYQPSRTRAERNRRTIYTFRYRTLADPMMEVFNRPGSEVSCERRDETTVTPQVFSLFNGQFVHNRALAMAKMLRNRDESLDAQIHAAFRATSNRTPTATELDACRAHVRRMVEHHRANPPQPVPLPTKVRRHMVEEMTGQDVHWEEQLTALADYQRDLMPWDVPPETRALAELCLVLLNSNEFLYVR